MAADPSTFQKYLELADMLVAQATKDELAECARLLAINCAHYKAKYGKLPLDEQEATLGIPSPNESQLNTVCDGMETFVGVLGNVVSGLGGSKH